MKNIPVEIKNVDLVIDMKVDDEAKLREAMAIVDEIKKKFGNDALIEQLSVVLSGTSVEKVTIVGVDRKPLKPLPTQVQVPTPPQPPDFAQLGMYRIQTPNCPITGHNLKNLDAENLKEILQTKIQFLHPQDAQYMAAYVEAWDKIPKPPVQQRINFEDDNIPF